MKITIKKSFERDVKKIRDRELMIKVLDVISDLEALESYNQIPNLKKLNGYKYSHRIAFAHSSVKYRICLNIKENQISIERFLPRSKSYRLFF